MAHIGCICGNDVRQNGDNIVHTFVSNDILLKESDAAFFGMWYGNGDKAEIWICNECGRALFFDDHGLFLSRVMRPVESSTFELTESRAKVGYCYDEELFFNEVDEYFTERCDAGLEPEYEFFDACYAEGRPLLTGGIMREKIFNNPIRSFGHWSRALLADDYLAVFDADSNPATERPAKYWILDKEETYCVTRYISITRNVLREYDPGETGAPLEAYASKYDFEAERLAASVSADSCVQDIAKTMARVLSESFNRPFTAQECMPTAEELHRRWLLMLEENDT